MMQELSRTLQALVGQAELLRLAFVDRQGYPHVVPVSMSRWARSISLPPMMRNSSISLGRSMTPNRSMYDSSPMRR